MSDYIDREKLLKQIEADSKGNKGQYGDEWLFLDTIKSIPPAVVKKTGEVVVNMTVDKDALKRMAIKLIEENDLVKVVRCKDCKYWRPDTRPEDSLEERTDGLWGWGNLCVKHLPADECEAIEFGPEEFCNFGERK